MGLLSLSLPSMPEAGQANHDAVTLYGIPNCDQVKKARLWLDQHQIAHHFHDFKKAGLEQRLLEAWLKQRGWEDMVNRKGTTWRKLAEQERPVDQKTAVALMLAQPSVIKRPVLAVAKQLEIGFNDARYTEIFR